MLGLTEDRLKGLADQFRHAATYCEGWEEALTNTARLLGANSAAVVFADTKTDAPTEFMIGGDVDVELISLYKEHYGPMDPASQAAKALPVGQVDSCHRYVENSFVARSEYYQEFLIPYGGRYSSGARLFDDGREWGRLGVQTNLRQGPIEGARFDALVRLTPHIEKAVERYRVNRIAKQQSRGVGMLDVLEQLGHGGALVYGDGCVVEMNHIGEQHVNATQGKRCVSILHRCLVAANRDAREAFSHFIALTAKMNRSEARECSLALPRGDGRRVSVRLSPVFDPLPASKLPPMVLIKLIDLDAPRTVAEDSLREIFGLTPAEARLAAALAGGKELNAVARNLGVAKGTARGQLKRIFEKTDTNGQPELAALLERMASVEAA